MGKPAGSQVRVLLVDDSAHFLVSAERFIRARASCQVVGTATGGEQALARVSSTRPDLVLVDIAMPGMGGLDLTRRLKALPEAPRVVILTMYDDAAHRAAAQAAGADAFLGKADFGENFSPVVTQLFGPRDGRRRRGRSPARKAGTLRRSRGRQP